MSVSTDLQRFLFERLSAAGFTVVDPPDAATGYPHISFGPAYDTSEDAQCFDTRLITVQLDIWSNAQDGQREAKEIADACHAALHRVGPGGLFSPILVTMIRIMRDGDRLWHGAVQIETRATIRIAGAAS